MLKELTSNYLVCKECFDLGNFPKVMTKADFEPQTIKSILTDSNQTSVDPDSGLKVLTSEDREKLLHHISLREQEDAQINWASIAQEAFKGQYSAKDLVFDFITMPISESLNLDMEPAIKDDVVEAHLNTRKRTLDAANQFLDEFPRNEQTSVFMDASNPLLSQVAIFARLLEKQITVDRSAAV